MYTRPDLQGLTRMPHALRWVFVCPIHSIGAILNRGALGQAWSPAKRHAGSHFRVSRCRPACLFKHPLHCGASAFLKRRAWFCDAYDGQAVYNLTNRMRQRSTHAAPSRSILVEFRARLEHADSRLKRDSDVDARHVRSVFLATALEM